VLTSLIKERHMFYSGGRVFDSEGIKIEGERERKEEEEEEEEEERRNI
jgi:hypothetical protein